MLGGQRFFTFLFSIFQSKASTPLEPLLCIYVLLHVLILTRCTRLFIVIVHCL
ncbi:hypothetical protein M6B38_378800 [Iris pallida]|uniref:Uncharacterized protein n=1 Tax=Iris pallida TaxID=29817 RepID=A0AAX6GA75_IRIPA|nr:hypothetical protein M6B38_378800 [Iris pallida]